MQQKHPFKWAELRKPDTFLDNKFNFIPHTNTAWFNRRYENLEYWQLLAPDMVLTLTKMELVCFGIFTQGKFSRIYSRISKLVVFVQDENEKSNNNDNSHDSNDHNTSFTRFVRLLICPKKKSEEQEDQRTEKRRARSLKKKHWNVQKVIDLLNWTEFRGEHATVQLLTRHHGQSRLVDIVVFNSINGHMKFKVG